MLIFSIFSLLLMKKVSPMKNSLFLIFYSLLVSVLFYVVTMSLFPCCSIIISYSSGMMIIFCYCSMMSDYDSKNNFSFFSFYNLILLCLLFLLFFESGLSQKPIGILLECLSLCPSFSVSMGVVLLAMISINGSMYNPKKSFLYSY